MISLKYHFHLKNANLFYLFNEDQIVFQIISAIPIPDTITATGDHDTAGHNETTSEPRVTG
jgi:hypothetical protein